MISAGVLDALLADGATAEQIVNVVKAAIADDEKALERRRNSDAERQRKHRLSRDVTLRNGGLSRDVTAVTVTEPPIIEHVRARVEGSSSSLVGTGKKERKKDTGACAPDPPEFLEFWNAYPHRIGKGDARKAWPRALEKAGSLAAILDGLQRYKRAKPPPPDGPPWCNPSTFLNQERWADQPLYTNGKTEGEVIYKFLTHEEVMADIERRSAGNGG